MSTPSLVHNALKEQNPTLFSSLQHSGKLTEFVQNRADEIASAIVSRQMELAKFNGLTESTPPMERVGILNMAAGLAREEVLSEMLEFPQDETSR